MILLDNCVSHRYLKLLQDWGYKADISSNYIPENASDDEVIRIATQLDAVLLTVDLDFANIKNYIPSQYQGIIVLRDAIEAIIADGTLKTVLAEYYRDGLRSVLIVIANGRYRIRN